MYESHGVGPTASELRPIKPPGDTFPVYSDLSERLAAPSPSLEPGALLPHVLSVAAAYSYAADPRTLATIMTRMGLERANCYTVFESVDAMLIDAQASLIQSQDGRVVILVFRGTPPLSTITWLANVDTSPHNIVLRSLEGVADRARTHQVHAGFYRNLRAIRYAVLRSLLDACEGRSVIPGGEPVEHGAEALYVAGHSLGGAMASLFTVLLRADDAYQQLSSLLRATCTYGQPMVGVPAFAAEVTKRDLGGELARYVYRQDPVPRFPPALTGEFEHFGTEYRYGASWDKARTPSTQSKNPLDLANLPGAALLRRTAFRWLPFPGLSVDDHNPANYVTALTPPGTPNEFGDDYFAP